jgi:iron complex outermembrane receptor protein
MFKKTPVHIAVANVVMAGMAVVQVAHAADDKIEEVIVTAQKREQKLQDVPISITAISGAQLETRGIEGNASLTGLAPNLQVNKSPASSLISQTSIRGSVTGQVAIYVDPAVGMYVDGVYIAKSQGNMFDLLDLERVEVLRGPQGTLFGRNTLGGAVSFVTRKPSGQWSGAVSLDVGNRGRHAERVSLDLPKMGILSLSVAMRNEQADGWLKNPNGKAEGDADRQAFRLAANLDISPSLKVDYAYDHTDIDEAQDPTTLLRLNGSSGSLATLGNILVGAGTAFRLPSYVTAGNNLIAAQTAMTPYVRQSRPSSIATDVGRDNYQRLRINGNALTATYAVNDRNTLKYIGGYRTMDYSDRLDLDGTPVPLISTGRNTDVKSYSNEIQWVGNTEKLNYAAGLFFYREDGTTLGGQLIALSPPPANTKYVNYRTTDNAKAIYGQFDYKATDALTLTAGVRRTSEERGNTSAQYGTNGLRGPITSTILPPTSASASWSATTPTLAATFKFNDGLTVYGRMAKGFRSGVFSAETPNVAGVTTPANPERGTTYEIGFKSAFAGGRAQLNGALFVNKISQMQVTRLPPGTTSSIMLNAGKATMEGFELEGVFLVADGWKLQASYGYLHGKFDEYMDYPLNAATAALAGVTTTTLIDTAGNRVMNYAPRHTFNLAVDGRLAKTTWGTLRGILDYTFISSFYAYPSNISLTAANAGAGSLASINQMPSQGLVNARLLLADVPLGGPGRTSVSLWVKNLTDSKKVSNVIDFGYFQNASWTPPRTYGASVSYKW